MKKNNSLKPQIRFKGYDEEWTTKFLSDSEFNIQAGGDVDKTLLHSSGNYPVIANALTDEGILGYYDEIYRIKAPAISITGRGDVGVAIPRRKNFTPVVRLLALSSPHDIDFLSCAINLHPTVLESTGVPQLTVPKLQSYRINFPAKKEQQEIGEYFRQIDTQIKEAEREVERLEKMKTASLQKMFPRPGATAPEIRFAGFSEPWNEFTVGDICTTYSGGTPSVNNSDFYGGTIPFIRSGEIHGNSTELFLTDKGLSNSSAALVKKGIILYALYGATSGEVAISQINGAINQAILAIIPEDNFNPLCICYWFKHNKTNIISTYLQGGQGNLSGALVKSIKLFLPSLDEQRAIGEYFRNLDELIAAKRKFIVKLRNIKKACLSKMFVNDTEQ